MENKQSIHTSNFVLTARKELIENRKNLFIGISSCWGLCMLLGAFLGFFKMGGGGNEVFIFFFLFSMISQIAGSLTFANMKTKVGRISTILLPSTAADKFLARWLAVVPGLLIILIIGFYIGDITRIVISWINNVDTGGSYYKITNFWAIILRVFGKSNISFLISTLIICGYFFSQALYIFGAILWPKLSFIKTMFALWVLQMTIWTGLMILKSIIGFSFFSCSEQQIITLLWCVAIILTLFTIGLYYLAYMRFKSSQVIYKLF